MDQPVQSPENNKKTSFSDKRLDSWKEIAQYLNRDVRTVMRWEKTGGLPVHRMPGGKMPGVYALQSELEVWLNESRQDQCPDQGVTHTSPEPTSIAVLPFLNLSHEKENEFFGDGLADEIITLLTRLPGLKVTARTSSFAFRNWNGDIREIGSKLGVRTLLEGSVQHSRGKMRISVQLINASDGFHIWGEVYDRKSEDIFTVQDDISTSVAQALHIHLVPGSKTASRRTGNPGAYREWIKGRYYLINMRSIDEIIYSRTCFERAIQIDPDYATGYLGLAEYYQYAAKVGLMQADKAFREGKKQALLALKRDETWADAHATLAIFNGVLEFDWKAAETGFLRALELDPSSPEINSQYAMQVLTPQGRLLEALERIKRALELDPLSPERHCMMSQIYVYQRKYHEAEACAHTAQSMGNFPFSDGLLGLIWSIQGRFEEALAICENLYKRGYANMPLAWAVMGSRYAQTGRIKEAHEMLSRIQAEIDAGRMSPLSCAMIHIELKNHDQAFDCLNRAIDQHDPFAIYLPVMPVYDPLRTDPRFPALLARMGLREYSGEH